MKTCNDYIPITKLLQIEKNERRNMEGNEMREKEWWKKCWTNWPHFCCCDKLSYFDKCGG